MYAVRRVGSCGASLRGRLRRVRGLSSPADGVGATYTLHNSDSKQKAMGIYRGKCSGCIPYDLWFWFDSRSLSTSANKDEDIAQLVENFTAPSLAKALRDREETLLQREEHEELQKILSPCLQENIERKRKKLRQKLDLGAGFTKTGLAVIQRLLHRQPREVKQSARRRASVVIPLCNVNGVASVLFERRSGHVRTHKHEVGLQPSECSSETICGRFVNFQIN